ncbi:MAG: AMP-binding protein, partial [Actinobacteria bacterium]|nr:AMP-binding protein [Actinomycetota bacterium]
MAVERVVRHADLGQDVGHPRALLGAAAAEHRLRTLHQAADFGGDLGLTPGDLSPGDLARHVGQLIVQNPARHRQNVILRQGAESNLGERKGTVVNTTDDRLPRYAQRVLGMAETDTELQALLPDLDVLERVTAKGQLFEQVIEHALSGYGDRPALGERDVEVVVESVTGRNVRGYLPSFHTVSYRELRRRVRALAEIWRRHPAHRVERDEFVVILGFAGIDYATVDLAIAHVRATEVPLQTTLAGHDLEGII